MILHYQITLFVISLAGCASILWCLRRNLLHPIHALWWTVIALFMLLAGLFPRVFDAVANYLGVTYPPTLYLFIGIMVLYVRLLLGDLERCRLMLQLRRLNQHQARMALRLRQLEKRLDESSKEIRHD